MSFMPQASNSWVELLGWVEMRQVKKNKSGGLVWHAVHESITNSPLQMYLNESLPGNHRHHPHHRLVLDLCVCSLSWTILSLLMYLLSSCLWQSWSVSSFSSRGHNHFLHSLTAHLPRLHLSLPLLCQSGALGSWLATPAKQRATLLITWRHWCFYTFHVS